MKHLSPDTQRVLQAYAAGVNAYLKDHKGPWPIQFVLAGDTPPELWTPADSVAVLKGMAMQLSGNAFTEAARAELIAVLGRRSVEDFFAPFSAAPLPGLSRQSLQHDADRPSLWRSRHHRVGQLGGRRRA